MSNIYLKIIGSVTLLMILAHPTYDAMRDFANQRNGRMQSTHYEFSRYLRHQGFI